ncbi:hypothetical protein ACH4U5_18315 [Streptomyces sp. NPDC020858]|uniref:hypothetical protein n=1 Tax=Streptomyces sp. NPDC020858 TaxID=3365097 RepID=UPI0037B4D1EE
MNGRRRTRSALTRALTVVCVVLLCVFGAGPAGAAAAEHRPSSTVPPAPAAPAAPTAPAAPAEPTEPTEGQSDPAAGPEARAAVRTVARSLTGVRRTPLAVFHVKHADGPPCGPAAGTADPAASLRAVRSVVLRC